MTTDEKKVFIRDLMTGIEAQMLEDIDKIPESWDGHELRQWLIDRTERAAGKLSGPRLRAYRNEYRVRNI